MREQIVREAKEWIGTPWHHHQSCKQVGCDCVGFLLGVARSVSLSLPNFENYGRTPANGELKHRLDRSFEQTKTPFAGDIILFRIKGVDRHVGILSGNKTFIHASQQHGVVEINYDSRWLKITVATYLSTPHRY